MTTTFLLFMAILCLVPCITSETPIAATYHQQRKLRTAQKVTSYVPQQPADSPTNFGFVPVKTAESYAQKEPSARYVYPDLLGQTQAYFEKYPQYQQTQTSQNSQLANYPQQTEAIYSQPETQQQVAQQYVYPQQYIEKYIQPTQDYAQKYVYQVPQAQQQQQQQYYYQPSLKNVNYITDNHVPQYVYLQHVPDSSNTVENVIDPKEQSLRYVMFIPTYVPQQPESQNYYVTKQTAAQDLSAEVVPPQPEQQIQYVYQTQPSLSHGKTFMYKKGATSLLDSYIPSAVQIQYYKRLAAQAQSNQISDSAKASAHILKKKSVNFVR